MAPTSETISQVYVVSFMLGSLRGRASELFINFDVYFC